MRSPNVTLAFPCVVCVAFAPSAASAQVAAELGAPGADAPAPPAPSRPAPVLESDHLRVAADAPAHPGPDFIASFGHAWAGYGIGAAAGGLTGGGIAALICKDDPEPGYCLVMSFVGAGIGAAGLAPFGAGLATWAFGQASGGTGNAFAAIGGAYLGTGVGSALLVGIAQLDPYYGMAIGAAVAVIATNLGAAAGYQLSSHGSGPATSGGVMAVPVAGGTPDGRGATIGAVGVF